MQIARQCGTPQAWVTIQGREVRFQPPPGANTKKLECILHRLELHPDLQFGFVGNELDPDRVLEHPWAYIAGGSLPALQHLAEEARKAGWVTGSVAKADDGTGFLTFHSAQGMTERQASAFAIRLSRHELGEIAVGPAPSRDGPDFHVE